MKRHISLLILLAAMSLGAMSATPDKSQCDSLYSAHLYDKALAGYEALLKHDAQNPDLLYNVGNCHYRLKHLPQAILYYERAARLNPSDDDVRYNLTLARAQTEDKFYSSSDLGVVYSFNSFVNTFGTDGWAWLSVVAAALLVAAIIVVRFSTRKPLRRTAFTVIFLSVVGIIVFNVFAFIQRSKYVDHSHAIVMQTTSLMSTPDTLGTTLFILHGGTKVLLPDTTMPAWSEVSLSDGQEGWVQNTDIDKI